MRQPDDDAVAALYAAEDSVSAHIGPAIRRWVDVEAFVDAALALDDLVDAFPRLGSGVTLGRRSRSARSSVAVWSDRTILIRDGSWNAVTICHELAHLACPPDEAHGSLFVATELDIVRRCCGIVAAAELRRSFVEARIVIGDVGP